MHHRPRLASLAICGIAAVTAGCTSPFARSTDEATATVTVLAAASLTDAFTTIASAFEGANPGVDVVLSFDGSSTLASRISEGAPGDVFASADEPTMRRVEAAGRVSGEPLTFASNQLQIVVPEDNPLGIAGLENLDRGLVLALCRRDVPCGAYAAEAFERAGLPWPDAAEEASVTAVLTKVRLGEADAGIVYRTDVRNAEGLEGIDLPGARQVRAAYPAAVLTDAVDPGAASDFVAYLLGEVAQSILAAAGFGPP